MYWIDWNDNIHHNPKPQTPYDTNPGDPPAAIFWDSGIMAHCWYGATKEQVEEYVKIFKESDTWQSQTHQQ